ncbi:MAG: GntR family transcriptional regulator [Lachnospiraceae bacterium]|nr:GntR family transcriptional regulator [Lachnospiraceae bacterium]
MKIIISTTMNLPIYEQIINQIRDAVVSGELREGEGMPSIRVLARDLQVSVITTKRAYEELEKEGVLQSIPGRGFYVCKQNNDILKEKQMRGLEQRYEDLIRDSKSAGMSVEDIIEMVQVLYET